LRDEPSACVPDFAGVAESAAVLACVHKSLAAWLALQVFVNASHINWVMMLMFCAEPWLYDSVVHGREQTYHSTGMDLELWSTGTNAVSFLPSRPCANLICGVEQLPKLAPEALEPLRTAPLFVGVEPVLLAPPTAFPVLSIRVTALKLVFKPKTLLNAGGKFSRVELTSRGTYRQPVRLIEAVSQCLQPFRLACTNP